MSDINWLVQSQKKARSLKFWMYLEEELYYPYSENRCADQLCSAPLFLQRQKSSFLMTWLN